MIKKTKMKNYEPPFAKDISVNFAKGQDSPMGVCKTGSAPYYACTIGPGVLPACLHGRHTRHVGLWWRLLPYLARLPAGKLPQPICFSGQGQQ